MLVGVEGIATKERCLTEANDPVGLGDSLRTSRELLSKSVEIGGRR